MLIGLDASELDRETHRRLKSERELETENTKWSVRLRVRACARPMFLARSISRLQITFHFHVSLCVKCQRKSRSYTISVVVVGLCVVRNRTLLGVLSRFVYLLDFILQNEPVVFEICVARVLFFFLTSTVLSSRLMMHSSVDWSGTLEARSQTQHEMN